MRIVYLHQFFLTRASASGTYPFEISRRLVERGHEVSVVASDQSGEGRGWRKTIEDGVHVHWYPARYSNHLGYGGRIRTFLRFAWQAGWKAASLPCDVIHAGSPPLPTALPAIYASRRRSVPMVFEVADLWPETAIAVGALQSGPAIAAARRLERLAYRSSAHVIAMSPEMKNGVVAAGYPADRVTVIPNGCNLEFFGVHESRGESFRRKHAWLGDRPLVVYTGTLGLVNGADYLARLAAAVRRRDPEVRFLLVGGGREEAKVRRVAAEAGVLEQTLFLRPPMPKSEMPDVLSAADMATSTVIDRRELWANSANKVFDALAAARPIVINHEGWIADFIRQSGCGLVLDPHDLEKAADALVAAIRDPLWNARARRAARQVAEERFSLDKLAGTLESVFESVIPRRRLRAAA